VRLRDILSPSPLTVTNAVVNSPVAQILAGADSPPLRVMRAGAYVAAGPIVNRGTFGSRLLHSRASSRGHNEAVMVLQLKTD
jgi:hypothetical protein